MPSLPELIPQEEGDEDDDSDDEIRVGNIIKDYKCPITTILLVDPVTKWVCELKDYSPEEIKNRKREKDQKSFWESCSLRHATPPSKTRSRNWFWSFLFLSHLSTIPPQLGSSNFSFLPLQYELQTFLFESGHHWPDQFKGKEMSSLWLHERSHEILHQGEQVVEQAGPTTQEKNGGKGRK